MFVSMYICENESVKRIRACVLVCISVFVYNKHSSVVYMSTINKRCKIQIQKQLNAFVAFAFVCKKIHKW